jgi:CRISPR system Cascade subunit CasD
VQTIPTAAAKRPDSRPQALRTAGRNVNTTITYREYRVGVLYAVALWGAPLEHIAAALRAPVFTLYLGRKSCPLSAPPDPRIVEAADALEALRHASRPPFHGNADIRLVASDEPLSSGDMVDMRHDIATDREKWHFTARRVHVHRPGPAAEALS